MHQISGDILHVDLSNNTSWREPITKNALLQFLGGRGISARVLWDLVKPGVDPLGPDNKLIFGAGLLSGTAAPSSGRTTVTCLSPATGLYLKSSAGGQWGAELKYAGVGNLVVHGRAEKPVYLWIDDDKVEFCDASQIWGLDVRQTNLSIQKELGDEEVQIAAIGPAGERLVRFAAVMFSVYHAAARGGVGAVMGSKNLKAIAVRGSGAMTPAKPTQFHETALKTRQSLLSDSGAEGLAYYGTPGSVEPINEMRVFPSYNFQRSSVDNAYPLTGQCLIERGYLKRRVACFSCVIGCHRYNTVERGAFAGSYGGGPEYETLCAFGAGCGVLETEPVIKANELCNIYGMDTISTGSVIQWAMECYERGVLSQPDLDGLELHWGNGQAMVEMVKKIAFREGFGNILAEGVKRAAEHVGGDTYKWAIEAKGLEQSRVDTRSAKAYALAFAVNPRGPDHLHTETIAEFGMSREARALIKKITGDEKYASPHLTEKRAEIVLWHEDCFALCDCLGFCCIVATALYGVTPQLMAKLFSTATGYDISEKAIMNAGRRIVTLEKCFNVRLGASRKDDTLPWRMMNEPSPDRPNAINSQEELDGMLDEYYSLHGWDKNTSWPTKATLIQLQLSNVAEELENKLEGGK